MSAALECLTANDGAPGAMCAAALTPPAAPPAPAEFRDLLPLRAGKRGVLVWMPCPEPAGHLAGFARLEMPGDTATYSVSECPCTRGRVLFVRRLEPRPGKRPNPGYAVQCIDGAALYCDCEARTPYCRHRDLADALLANGWV